MPGVVVHAFDWEAEAGRCLWVQGQPGWPIEWVLEQPGLCKKTLKKPKAKPNIQKTQRLRDSVYSIKAVECSAVNQ